MNTSGKSRIGYQGAMIALLAALLIGPPAAATTPKSISARLRPRRQRRW